MASGRPATGRKGHALTSQLVRFLFVGAANTLITSLGFLVLSLWIAPALAFTLVYFTGLVFVMTVTPRVVFGVDPGWRRVGTLGLWYVAVYGAGLLVLRLLEHRLDAPHLLIVAGTLVVTVPLNFVGSRFIVGRPKVSAASRPSP
jgi:putative flippase GtrA